MTSRCFAFLLILLSLPALAEDLTVTLTKDLDFGEQFAGNGSEAITTANGGVLTVTNNTSGNKIVRVVLNTPTATMTEPSSGQGVLCSAIATNPGTGTFFIIGAGASSTIQVGGTRAALSGTQAPGFYTGPVSIRVTSFLPTANFDTTVNAKFRVLPSIAITKVRNLVFGGATANDVAKTIAPTSSSSARFRVTGGTGKIFSISLPPSTASSNLTTGAGGTTRTINVTGYTSNPSGTGTLDSVLGEAFVDVGATRAAILSNQVQGTYTGSFTVTVTYQ